MNILILMGSPRLHDNTAVQSHKCTLVQFEDTLVSSLCELFR